MFSGTISGLLAYGISFMNGAGGLAGWRWVGQAINLTHSGSNAGQVFILEGLPILLCAVYTFFYLPNCKRNPLKLFTVLLADDSVLQILKP